MSKRRLPYRFKVTPFDHQLYVWSESKDLTAYGYLWDMGVGKTKLALDVSSYLYDKGKIDAVLVFSNKGSYTNWTSKEIPEHMPDHVKYTAHAWDNSPTKKARSALRSFVLDDNGLKILVMNIEALACERSARIAYKYARIQRTLTIVDESTTIKNPKAKRTRAAIAVGKVSKYRRIMSGMAIENSPLDVYSQCQFLGDWLLGFSSYYSFRAHYAHLVDMKNAQRSWKIVTGYKNVDELTERLQKFCSIIKSEDCLDLPEKIYQEYEVELTAEQKRVYKQFKAQSIVELENTSVITASIVLTKMLRLHQIVCGYVKDEDGVEQALPTNRMEALDAVLAETDRAIIWATYRPNLKEIIKHLTKEHGSDAVAHYYGDTTDEEREAAKVDFQSGKVRYLVGNPQTGGFGLTLTRANVAVYYSNNYRLGLRAQSEKRCHRIGQTRNVTYVDLVVRRTVDDKILKSLRKKKEISNKILVSNWQEIFS